MLYCTSSEKNNLESTFAWVNFIFFLANDSFFNQSSLLKYKIFKEIASKLGFAYTVSPPVQCCLWGQEQSPGNYTGLVGDLQSSRSDVGWANMFVQPFRKQLIDFTAPFKSDYVCFVV